MDQSAGMCTCISLCVHNKTTEYKKVCKIT